MSGPEVGSVWGVPGKPETWRYIMHDEEGQKTGRSFSGGNWWILQAEWDAFLKSGAVDLTASLAIEPAKPADETAPQWWLGMAINEVSLAKERAIANLDFDTARALRDAVDKMRQMIWPRLTTVERDLLVVCLMRIKPANEVEQAALRMALALFGVVPTIDAAAVPAKESDHAD